MYILIDNMKLSLSPHKLQRLLTSMSNIKQCLIAKCEMFYVDSFY